MHLIASVFIGKHISVDVALAIMTVIMQKNKKIKYNGTCHKIKENTNEGILLTQNYSLTILLKPGFHIIASVIRIISVV